MTLFRTRSPDTFLEYGPQEQEQHVKAVETGAASERIEWQPASYGSPRPCQPRVQRPACTNEPRGLATRVPRSLQTTITTRYPHRQLQAVAPAPALPVAVGPPVLPQMVLSGTQLVLGMGLVFLFVWSAMKFTAWKQARKARRASRLLLGEDNSISVLENFRDGLRRWRRRRCEAQLNASANRSPAQKETAASATTQVFSKEWDLDSELAADPLSEVSDVLDLESRTCTDGEQVSEFSVDISAGTDRIYEASDVSEEVAVECHSECSDVYTQLVGRLECRSESSESSERTERTGRTERSELYTQPELADFPVSSSRVNIDTVVGVDATLEFSRTTTCRVVADAVVGISAAIESSESGTSPVVGISVVDTPTSQADSANCVLDTSTTSLTEPLVSASAIQTNEVGLYEPVDAGMEAPEPREDGCSEAPGHFDAALSSSQQFGAQSPLASGKSFRSQLQAAVSVFPELTPEGQYAHDLARLYMTRCEQQAATIDFLARMLLQQQQPASGFSPIGMFSGHSSDDHQVSVGAPWNHAADLRETPLETPADHQVSAGAPCNHAADLRLLETPAESNKSTNTCAFIRNPEPRLKTPAEQTEMLKKRKRRGRTRLVVDK
ncbi:MAG: hypothetical protein KVP17_003823 [Porospora cf. gigantea B]|uniref:uncharacterized protein n=1 Tax=Porospora cf. gigantea B TaxID=2853592 RepID=UPI00357191E5|nr:MAG: hypothetical protein KVP17_003823 [Porospora cf. gigantea B]